MNKIDLKIKKEFRSANQKYFKYIDIAWVVLGTFMLFDDDKMGWFYLGLGLIHYLFHSSINNEIHASIHNGVFKKNTWFASKTDLKKAKYVKKFAGDVTFVFSNKETRIETQTLEEESIELLDQFINENEIPCEVIPIR
ncbi:hypothetical protein [Psychroflexus planctonicus]|uniref:YcxB-like protein domain-containing protein n=1 Tax=Psychroflexus planctonicus TaxID=1526575 RepID=A0ABQ1SHP8_9FLAO|nr:hypothetical protein [Psychroflexus planctonicus]GGE36704.1 hypothetical protein GCM10010832_16100 [Psychroflexus planctonicus]